MSDIVVRLRFWGDSYHLYKEAADEIEKLRTERDALREVLRTAKDLYLHGSTTSVFIEICAALGEKK